MIKRSVSQKPGEPKQKRKKTLGYLLLPVIALFAFVIYLIYLRLTPGNAVIAKVNGDEITAAELERVLNVQRASIISYFNSVHHVQYGKDFWYSCYNGEVPAETAKRMALDEAVKLKLQLALFKKHGLIRDTSYGFLVKEMKKENDRRAKAIKKGEPVYGPVKLDINAFVDYFISHAVIQLKEILSKDELEVTEEKLRQHYESVKERLYKLEDRIRFVKVAVSFLKDGQQGHIDQAKKRKAGEVMAQIKKQWDDGEDIDELVKRKQEEHKDLVILCKKEEMNKDTARDYAKVYSLLYAGLNENPGAHQMSEVIEDEMHGEYVLLKVLEREKSGYKDYEEYKGSVKSDYLDKAYSEYLDQLLEAAEIEVMENNLKKIIIE